ncbi:RHS repeat-associated core domain-containing protein [Metapseudomonas otitidis]|uniref:RHS repeat-associated core domain-containing protein n=1 Tax=Metapseudomonas otitidis TaxID=319939 RepID=UPI0013F6015C|nr:RHS repeat-associated core domain-containing protein [Pseudomonas otitidis]
MFEAARLHDELVHTSALTGFLIGAALGLALVAAVAFATLTCGFGVALLAGLAAGFGGSLLTSLGEGIGRMFTSPAGGILSGSPDVFINGLNAAQVEGSVGTCEKHPTPPPLVAEGSAKVFYNGLAAARKGDKLTCGAMIDSGSGNTFVGADSVQYLEIDDEVPEWLRTTVDILMALAGAAGSLAGLVRMAGRQGLKAVTPCALKFIAGFTAGEVAGRYMVGPAIERAIGGLFGNPVDAVSGRKLLLEDSETDFSLPGLMPITWSRFYASNLQHDGLLGRGWILPWEQCLYRDDEQLLLRDNQGRELPLPSLSPGERVYVSDQQFYLVCTEGGHYLLQTLDNHFFYFGETPLAGASAPLRRIENALGHFLSFSYDDEQRLSDICASGGIRLHLCYERGDRRLTRVERVVDRRPVETLVHYQYDAQGQLIQVTDRNGQHTRRFAYTGGLMVAHENSLGLLCEYRWAKFGPNEHRVVEHWTNDGERYHFKYDLAERKTLITDALEREALLHYNDQLRVVASTDFGGEQYRITLDADGNMIGLTLPDGAQLTLAYDELSRLIEEVDPLGRCTRYQYHLDSNLLSTLERAYGSSEHWVYDRNGTLLESVDALGQITRYCNNADGLPYRREDALGNTTHLGWNDFGQLLHYQDCSGQRSTYRYDERQQLTEISNALNETTRLHRRASGEIELIEHPDGSRDQYRYNALGQVISHTNGDGHTTYLERNPRGQPTQRKDARGERVRYYYDQAQRLTRLVNENGAIYQFRYDASDRLQEEIRLDGLRRRYRYSLSGALLEREELAEQGQQVSRRVQQFEHDAAGRLLSRISADGRLDYRYDAADRLLGIIRTPSESGQALGIEAEQLDFTYDAAGRLSEERSSQGALGYEYDALGNLSVLRLPDGRALNHQYYGSGHLHHINLDGLLISDIERDALHRESLRTQGALTSRYRYDLRGRRVWQNTLRLAHETVSDLMAQHDPLLNVPEHPACVLHRRYHYSDGGELKRVADKFTGLTDYRYDAIGQLDSREPKHAQLHSEDFRYDAAGNLCGSGWWAVPASESNRLEAWRDLRFSYDAWGNLSEKSTDKSSAYQRFAYDSENRLIRAETWHGARLHSCAQYRYDSLGRRTGKTVTTHARHNGGEPVERSERTDFLWQGLRLLQERRDTLHSLYVYEPGSYAPLARLDSDPLQPDKLPQRYYFHTDPAGTPQELTDADGQIVWRAFYKAWGGLEAVSPKQVEQNLRFQGQYHDRETGLHYNTFRYYDPSVGRFTTQDPIGLAGGINLYQYAPNALGWIDPLGWCSSTLGRNMGARPGDGMANHHLIPEALIRDRSFNSLFSRLKNIGWNGDAASNGIFLPGSKDLASTINMPGHWSSHAQYTGEIRSRLSQLASQANRMSDMQLALGVKEIQDWARAGLTNGRFGVHPATGRLL